MPFTPNATPNYARAPIPVGPVAFPSTAKTVFTDTSNATQILASMADNRQVVTQLYAEVTATLTAGKLMAYLVSGTTAFQVADVPHAAMTISTTAGTPVIAFTLPGGAIIVPEGFSLWIASAVAQPAGALIGYGIGKLF